MTTAARQIASALAAVLIFMPSTSAGPPPAAVAAHPDVQAPFIASWTPLHAVYHPGETISVLIECLREPWRKSGDVPRQHYVASCSYRMTDPEGNVVASQLGRPSEGAIPFMGPRLVYPIPSYARLGTYHLEATMTGPGITPGRGIMRRSFTVSPTAPHPPRGTSRPRTQETPERPNGQSGTGK